jgi:DNA-binding CsgD family transcriptional regulator
MGNGTIRPADTLTKREKQVVGCVMQAMKNREIARHLGIAEQTVKEHLQSIFDKYGVSTKLELLVIVIQNSPPTFVALPRD